jgi:hypothetical protein
MRNEWTERDLEYLFMARRLRESWETIAAALPGRSVGSCKQAYTYRQNKAAAAAARRANAGKRAILPAAPIEPAPSPSARAVSTSALIVDAELRARIAVQGLTAGLLGDPPAGRSALDQRGNGTSEAAAAVDRRSVRLGPKVTLATVPLR